MPIREGLERTFVGVASTAADVSIIRGSEETTSPKARLLAVSRSSRSAIPRATLGMHAGSRTSPALCLALIEAGTDRLGSAGTDAALSGPRLVARCWQSPWG